LQKVVDIDIRQWKVNISRLEWQEKMYKRRLSKRTFVYIQRRLKETSAK